MPNKDKFAVIFSVITFVAFLAVAAYFGGIYQSDVTTPQDMDGDSPEDIVTLAKSKTFAELKRDNPDLVKYPNVFDAELRQRFEESGDITVNPENYVIVFDALGFSPQSVEILRGDIVTWRNAGNQSFMVVGEEDWSSVRMIEPGGAFSQGFDFAGRYRYFLGDSVDIWGEVLVVTP